MSKGSLTATDQKLLGGLSKPTKSARVRAERLLLEQMLDSGIWLSEADRLAAPLVKIAASGDSGGAAAMRLLGNLIGEGDRAISTGPVPEDPDLKRFDAPYAQALGSKKWQSVAALLAKHVAAFEAALGHEDAPTRGSAAFLLAHIPAAKGALAKLKAQAKVESDPDVLAALVFASGHLARYAKKEPLSAPAAANEVVGACAVLARVVASGAAPDAAGETALIEGIAAAPRDPTRFPWRDGALDKVTTTVCDNRLGGAFTAALLAKTIRAHPDDERALHWVAVTLELGFPGGGAAITADTLSDAQRALLDALSVRDWKQLNSEFAARGLPPHAEDRRALVRPSERKASVLDREIEGPSGRTTVLEALRSLFAANANFDAFHELLGRTLSPSDHLEVAQLAAAQRLGLSHMGDAGPMALAQKHAAACLPWAKAALAAAPKQAAPRGDFWITLALFIELEAGKRTTIEAAFDEHVRADARILAIAQPVLAALPPPRREKLLLRFAGADVKTGCMAFLPLAHVCPTASVLQRVLDVTEPGALDDALGPGVASWIKTRVLPALPMVLAASEGPDKKRLEKRLEQLRATLS